MKIFKVSKRFSKLRRSRLYQKNRAKRFRVSGTRFKACPLSFLSRMRGYLVFQGRGH